MVLWFLVLSCVHVALCFWCWSPNLLYATRDTKLCKWLKQLGADNGDDVDEEPLDEEEDVVGGCIEGFDHLDNIGGIDGKDDEDLSDKEVVDEGNFFNWGGLWLLCSTIWYYMVLYGIIPRSPCMFQSYITLIANQKDCHFEFKNRELWCKSHESSKVL